jgi:hypothetical protein
MAPQDNFSIYVLNRYLAGQVVVGDVHAGALISLDGVHIVVRDELVA